jgi:peptide/nickel transport system permease protein
LNTISGGPSNDGNDYAHLLRENLKWRREHQKIAVRRFFSNGSLGVGALLFVLVVAAALLGPALCVYDPFEMAVTDRLHAPSAAHPMGTDEFGRDLLTRVVYGTRVSIGVGTAVAVCASLMGLVIGVCAAYYPLPDYILMRICDGMSSIPGILLAITLMAVLGASEWNVVIALSVVYIPSVARIVRAAALLVKESSFIEALRVQGAGDLRILVMHIVPNVLPPLLVQSSFVFAGAILSEASLSFLGAGIPAPAASWGNILQAGKGVIHKAWWMVVFPGAMIVLSVLSLTLLGDGLRDFLDPRTKDR